jgi:DNA-binding IclR family transcriptional regulator
MPCARRPQPVAVDPTVPAARGDRSAEILKFVNDHSESVRAKDVAEAIDISDHEARTYLARLFDTGKVRKPKRGLYAPVATVASVASDEGTQPESNTGNTP